MILIGDQVVNPEDMILKVGFIIMVIPIFPLFLFSVSLSVSICRSQFYSLRGLRLSQRAP